MVLLIAVVVVLAIVVGGLTQVSRQSTGYDANSARTLAAQGTVAADQSNATSATVRKVVNDLPSQTRQGLQAALDGAVLQTSDEAARAELAAGSTPLGSVATQFAAVFAERAQAVTQLRAAVYGFLGMQPIAPADAPAARRERRPRAGPPSCRPPRPRTALPPPARSCRIPTRSTALSSVHWPPAPAMESCRRRCG